MTDGQSVRTPRTDCPQAKGQGGSLSPLGERPCVRPVRREGERGKKCGSRYLMKGANGRSAFLRVQSLWPRSPLAWEDSTLVRSSRPSVLNPALRRRTRQTAGSSGEFGAPNILKVWHLKPWPSLAPQTSAAFAVPPMVVVGTCSTEGQGSRLSSYIARHA